jgi:putative hydrolase of HD superfamily
VIKLLLVHDVVEIDAGDAPIHVVGKQEEDIELAEKRAAERVFGLLPPPQNEELLALWLEFEGHVSRKRSIACNPYFSTR